MDVIAAILAVNLAGSCHHVRTSSASCHDRQRNHVGGKVEDMESNTRSACIDVRENDDVGPVLDAIDEPSREPQTEVEVCWESRCECILAPKRIKEDAAQKVFSVVRSRTKDRVVVILGRFGLREGRPCPLGELDVLTVTPDGTKGFTYTLVKSDGEWKLHSIDALFAKTDG
ncbi:MAG: hypothetical protein SF187_12945 [Deltaproteobacteria bacterium]|nr:hypothetical protein [Deltaproteobacteria bacterium]